MCLYTKRRKTKPMITITKKKGKQNCALITGAAGLLGEEHAIALLEINKNVILTDINLNKLEILKKKLKKKFITSEIYSYKMDVTKEKSIAATWKYFKKKKIIIDVLINNAAIDPKFKNYSNKIRNSRFEYFSSKNWEKECAVGLTGSLLCSKIFGNELIRNKINGVILNIASDLSVISPNQNIYKNKKLKNSKQPVKPISYSVIKHGVIGLTKYLSTYWAPENIRCNALSPGPILNFQPKTLVSKLKNLIPMARLAHKNEYRSAVKFLCTDESSYMTGQNIIIDGGRSVW